MPPLTRPRVTRGKISRPLYNDEDDIETEEEVLSDDEPYVDVSEEEETYPDDELLLDDLVPEPKAASDSEPELEPEPKRRKTSESSSPKSSSKSSFYLTPSFLETHFSPGTTTESEWGGQLDKSRLDVPVIIALY